MKLIFVIIFLIFSLSSLFAQGALVTVTVHASSLENNILGDSPDRSVNIYLPPNYESEFRKYPVIYLLHGYNGNHNLWIGQGYLSMNIKTILDNLISQQKIHPLIVVMPDGSNKYGGSWYTNSNVTGNWEDFICNDLVEYIDQNYLTLQQPDSRGISGHSMGGYGAFKIAMKNPEIFGSVYSMSTAFTDFEDVVLGKFDSYLKKAITATTLNGLEWQTKAVIAAAAAFAPNENHLPFYGDFPISSGGEIIDSIWAYWIYHDPPTMVLNNLENLSKLNHIALECGKYDANIYNPNINLSQLLNQENIQHFFEDYDGDHTSKIHLRIKENMLPFFSEALAKVLIEYVPPGAEWAKTFGGSKCDMGYAVQQTSDGGYVLSGTTNFNHADTCDGYLIKTDVDGDTIWTRTFYGTRFSSLKETTDGGYVITGKDAMLIKTNANGDSLWGNKPYGKTDGFWGASIEQTLDGGYVLTGSANFPGKDNDILMIKTDTYGDTLWTKTFGGSYGDNGYDIQQTIDGGYIIAGSTDYSLGTSESDVWLIKTDTKGDTEWTKTYGGSLTDIGHAVKQTSDGGYILVAETESFSNGDWDLWLIKTDVNGDSVWAKTYGGSQIDGGNAIQQTSDGGYIITGMTESFGSGDWDLWIIKTDANGDSVWTKTFGGSKCDMGHAVHQTSDGGYIVTGFTNSFGAGDSDVWLIKLAAEPTSISENPRALVKNYQLLQNYPNPFNPITKIQFTIPNTKFISRVILKVYDILGREVATLVNGKQKPGNYEVKWGDKNQPSGVYFYRLKAGEFVETKKMILLR